jgi:uncharacterized membrane protein YGL010W
MGYIETYRATHQNRVNRALHSIGIPMILVSLPLFFWKWKIALGLFILGWILQFVGHIFEGKMPAFFSNPVYLITGTVWWIRKFLGLEKNKSN